MPLLSAISGIVDSGNIGFQSAGGGTLGPPFQDWEGLHRTNLGVPFEDPGNQDIDNPAQNTHL